MATKYLMCLVLFGLAGCSDKAVMTTKTKAQSKSTVNISTLSTIKAADEQVKVVGDFTNIESNGEHQWGYSVEIWKQRNKIFGLISGDSASRIIGDPPTGLLENIFFDEKTGEISFKAILPSELCEFKGILAQERLKGKLLNTETNKTEIITLRRSKELSSEMDEFQTYEDWKKYADEILKFRGPR